MSIDWPFIFKSADLTVFRIRVRKKERGLWLLRIGTLLDFTNGILRILEGRV